MNSFSRPKTIYLVRDDKHAIVEHAFYFSEDDAETYRQRCQDQHVGAPYSLLKYDLREESEDVIVDQHGKAMVVESTICPVCSGRHMAVLANGMKIIACPKMRPDSPAFILNPIRWSEEKPR